ncbi:acylneuraminate cytidylyltransferase family protein [Nitrosopumilus sp.]|nr:acylneuraminate cytidylyltransferase family protein [Nitrosopumilus sp.]
MKSLCFIAARGGSKGVPRKNIRTLVDKPLIAHTIEKSLNSKIFSNVIVSTEDKEIAKIAKEYGAEVPFMRPKKLSTDTTGMVDVMIHGINKLHSLGYEFDIFVNRDCTVPFIRNKDIKSSINLLKKKKCNAVYGVYVQHFNPYFNMLEMGTNGYLKFSKKIKNRPHRRQDSPKVFQLNGLFVYDTKSLLKFKTQYPPNGLPWEIPLESGLMIDTELEFKTAEMMIKNQLIPN